MQKNNSNEIRQKENSNYMHFKQLNKLKKRIALFLIITLSVSSMTFPSLSAPLLSQITNFHSPSDASSSDATDSEWVSDDIGLFNDLDVSLLKSSRIVDNVNPEITNITATVDEVDLPGTITFTVDIIEDGSGLQSITARFCNTNNSNFVNKTYSFPAGTYSGTFELEYTMDDITLPSGIWDIELVATDNNFNSSNDFSFVSFNSGRFYVNGNDDFKSPVISDVRIISNTVSAPGEIVVEVDVTDESGIQSVMVNLQGTDEYGNQSTAGKNCYFDSNNTTDTYMCRVPIDKNAVSGTWKLHYVSACDTVNNHSNGTILEEWEQQSCTVVNYYRDDTIKPVVNSVSFSSTFGTAPYSFDVILDITKEDAGVEGIYITLSNYETQTYKQCSLTSFENDGKSGKCIKVKSTKRLTCPDLDDTLWIDTLNITRNEWVAAHQHRGYYSIYRVFFTRKGISIFVIKDIADKIKDGHIQATPMTYRIDFSNSSVNEMIAIRSEEE